MLIFFWLERGTYRFASEVEVLSLQLRKDIQKLVEEADELGGELVVVPVESHRGRYVSPRQSRVEGCTVRT